MEIRRNGNLTIFAGAGATMVFVLLLVVLLNYFKVLSLSKIFPNQFDWLPKQGSSPPPATQTSSSYPIDVNHSSVESASLYYRIIGIVERISQTQSGNLLLEVTAKSGRSLPYPFNISDQTSITDKKSGAAVSAGELKAGDFVEVIYLVDLKTGNGIATQIVIER